MAVVRCCTRRNWAGAAMKSFLSILALLALTLTGAAAKETDFPKAGTPYAEARANLLRQGLKIAPDQRTYDSPEERAALKKKGIIGAEPVPSADPKFTEIDCWKLDDLRDPGVKCRALFLETNDRGWKVYVIVPIEPKTLAVGDVGYPSTADGLPSIPPPLAKDLPQIKGSYFSARTMLKRLGFRPARNHNIAWAGRVCSDRKCEHVRILPEAGCSGTGASFCTAYWISKDNRVLKVTTIWEYPEVYYAEWSNGKNLKNDFRKLPD